MRYKFHHSVKFTFSHIDKGQPNESKKYYITIIEGRE